MLAVDTTAPPPSDRIMPKRLPTFENTIIAEDGTEEFTRYVEVPVFEEVVRTIPKIETVEVEKHLDNVQTEFVDRVVPIEEVRRVKKVVEVPQIQEVIKQVTRREVVPVTKEVVKYVKRAEVRIIEEEKRIPGQRIEVPKIIDVPKEVIVPRYVDTAVNTIVAQTVIPVVVSEGDESKSAEEIEAVTYEPVLVPVDVLIAKPVDRPIICEGKLSESIKPVQLPAPQYNTILRSLNTEMIRESKQAYRDLPFQKQEDGSVHFIRSKDTQFKPFDLPANAILGSAPPSRAQQRSATQKNSNAAAPASRK